MTLERKCSDGREEHVWLHFPWHHLKYNPVKGMMDGMSCHRRREKVSLFLGQLLVQSRGRQLQADVSQLPSPVLPLSFTSPDLHSGSALASSALPKCRRLRFNSVCICAGSFTWSVLSIPEDLWSQSRTRGHSYVNRAARGRKINSVRVRRLIYHQAFGR